MDMKKNIWLNLKKTKKHKDIPNKTLKLSLGVLAGVTAIALTKKLLE